MAAGGAYLSVSGSSGGNINCYNNIVWGNTGSLGGDILLGGTSTTNGFNNDYKNMAGKWNNSGNNINAAPLLLESVTIIFARVHPVSIQDTILRLLLSSTDFEGDLRDH